MLAYQQQQQQQQQQQSAKVAVGTAASSVIAVPPASTSLANSKLRFGNTGLSSWNANSNALKNGRSGGSPHQRPAKNDHFTSSSNSNNAYRLHAGSSDAHPTASRSQQASRGNHRANVNPAFAAPHWQNYHKHYQQQLHLHKERDAASASKNRSVRRIPNANDINKQWRATTAQTTPASTATTTASASAASIKPAASRETAPLMSSTFQGNDSSSLLSGLSLALNKHKLQNQPNAGTGALAVDTASSAAKPSAPLFDASQSRTPNPLSPAISMKTPAYVDPDSLPFELGTSITDTTTGKQYHLLSVLGEGSYAVVYLARCSDDGAKYALKCLSKLGLTPRQLALQRTELEIHASVCPHPHIVTLYSHFETRDWLFLVMERIAGPDLYDYITQHPAFNANQEERRFVEATRLFEQMIDAVAHIHASKAYHRDLKPENFILGADGNLKLTDFGLATRESLSTDFECGSKPYMSYENRNGGLNPNDPTVYGPRDDYSPRLSDVWALGVLFLNLLFAQSPWTDPSRESCFKFCRFLREGAGFLVNQFPRLPREVADFLVTRIFSPESGRCNVLELKQWVQDLGYPFTLTASASVARSSAQRHKNAAGATTGRRTVAVPAPSAAHGAKGHVASSADKKWSPAQGTFSGSVSKMPHVPHAVLASTALALDTAVAASSSKPRSPHNKRFTAMQSAINAATAGTASSSKPGHLSTSVPAAVFSQIIPATQAAAARKMMPREFNQTAAKAAAAILQSSMLCLPKNGLGQGKIDDSADTVFAFDEENEDNSFGNDDDDDDGVVEAIRAAGQEGSSSWNHLEDLSEAAEEDDGDVSGAYSSAAAVATDISRTFPKQPVSASLGFSLSKNLDLFDSEDDMDFTAPISFDDADRPPIRVSAKSLPAHKHNLASYTLSKRPLPLSAGVVPNAISEAAATVPTVAGATGSSTVSDSSFGDDMMDIVGHFSDTENGHSAGNNRAEDSLAIRSANRVRFKEIPQAPPVHTGRASLARVAHPGEDATTTTNVTTSADSSLTATLVTPSVDDYYGARLKRDQAIPREPVSATTLVSNSNGSTSSTKSKTLPKLEVHDMDADDEGEGNWRTLARNNHLHSNSNKNKFDSVKTARHVDFGQFSHGKNNHILHKTQGKASHFGGARTRDAFANNGTSIAKPAQKTSTASGKGHAGMPVMHSLPTAMKPLSGLGSSNNNSNSRSRVLDLDAEQPAFSWADDVEDMPIPSLTAQLHNTSASSRHVAAATAPATVANFGDDALSDELSWFSEDDHFQQSGGVFAMEL